MTWNVNSLAKDDFRRVRQIEAENSLFNYDLNAICETSLNSSIEIPDPLLANYTFISANNPNDSRHGGVGLFYKNSMPLKVRYDLSFNETIVVEIMFGRKKVFFTVFYRSPAVKANSVEFSNFLDSFSNLHKLLKNENPYAVFYTGDLNGHSQLWWAEGDTTAEGREIETLTSSLGLVQVINEPTNFEPYENPSCIDLIFTDQQNLILSSGTRSSLDPYCHHQIIY